MQPELLKGMAKNNRNNGGFLDRFLFCLSRKLKPKVFTGLKINTENEKNYNKLIWNLLEAPEQQIKADNQVVQLLKDLQHEKAKEFLSNHLEASL